MLPTSTLDITLGNPDAYSEVHGKFGNNCLDGIFVGSTRITITETKGIPFFRKDYVRKEFLSYKIWIERFIVLLYIVNFSRWKKTIDQVFSPIHPHRCSLF